MYESACHCNISMANRPFQPRSSAHAARRGCTAAAQSTASGARGCRAGRQGRLRPAGAGLGCMSVQARQGAGGAKDEGLMRAPHKQMEQEGRPCCLPRIPVAMHAPFIPASEHLPAPGWGGAQSSCPPVPARHACEVTRTPQWWGKLAAGAGQRRASFRTSTPRAMAAAAQTAAMLSHAHSATPPPTSSSAECFSAVSSNAEPSAGA